MEVAGDVLVLGGGLAGCAAALELARAGRRVTLVEREASATHKVCGEFLSAEALRALDRMGVSAAALGAVPILAVRVVSAGGSIRMDLPFEAMSLTRRRLDDAMLCRATHGGVQVLRGENVEQLTRTGGEWRSRLSGGRELVSRDVFLATGKHDLRGHARPEGKQGDLVAFKMYFALAPAQQEELAKHVELHLFRGGYAGLQPVEDGVANLCCVVRKATLRAMGGNWDALLTHMQRSSPLLRERLRDANAMLPRPLAISSIPYGYVRERAAEGLWSLGDQAAVIPSFTGDGMSIALHSGWLAARMLLASRSASEFQSTLQQRVHRQVRLATWLSRAMVSAAGQRMAAPLLRAWPGALPRTARATRLDDAQTF